MADGRLSGKNRLIDHKAIAKRHPVNCNSADPEVPLGEKLLYASYGFFASCKAKIAKQKSSFLGKAKHR
jgi:hypothetical protein